MSDNDQTARIADLKRVRDSWCEEATRQRDRIAVLETALTKICEVDSIFDPQDGPCAEIALAALSGEGVTT